MFAAKDNNGTNQNLADNQNKRSGEHFRTSQAMFESQKSYFKLYPKGRILVNVYQQKIEYLSYPPIQSNAILINFSISMAKKISKKKKTNLTKYNFKILNCSVRTEAFEQSDLRFIVKAKHAILHDSF